MSAEQKIEDLEALRRRAASLATMSRAPRTMTGYNNDWKHFTEWCAKYGLPTLPADQETVCLFLAAMVERKLKAGTIKHMISAIGYHHDAADHPSPTRMPRVRQIHAGLKRELGTMPLRKTPLLPAHLLKIRAALPQNLRGLRDAAILLLGFAGALRKSELTGLDVADLTFRPEGGMQLLLRRAKTDKARAGQRVAIMPAGNPEICPITTLRTWLERAEITEGPLFRMVTTTGQVYNLRLGESAVAGIVKRAVKRIGLDPATFSSHSLRRGMITSAIHGGADPWRVGRHARQDSIVTTMMYVAETDGFTDNPVALVL